MGEEIFQKLLKRSKISDKEYPVKGANILLPFGKKILSNIEELFLIDYRKRGYQEVNLPNIIPENMTAHLRKEGMFKFNNEHGAYFLAPGYESQAVLLLKSMVDNHNMLPIRVFNQGNAYRHTAKTHLIKNLELRIIEFNSFFIEKEQAAEELLKLNEISGGNLDKIGIPYIKVKDSQEENGQYKFVTFFPHSKKFGTVSCNLMAGDRYSKKYSVSFKDKTNKIFYPIQVNGGFTGRILAAYLSNHMNGEDGFKLDSKILPYQAVINKLDFNTANLTELIKKLDERNISYLLLRKKSNNESYRQFIASGIPIQIGHRKNYLKIRLRKQDVMRVDCDKELNRILSLLKDEKTGNSSIKTQEINKTLREYEPDTLYVTDNSNFNPENKIKFIGFNEDNNKVFVRSKY